MSIDATKPGRSTGADDFQIRLQQDPFQWDLYTPLADCYVSPIFQSHTLLRGAWQALSEKQYAIAQQFSDEAQKRYGETFCVRVIDIELLRAQKQNDRIPAKLLEIAQLFEKRNLPAQAVKAYKRHTRFHPIAAKYQKVIALYAQINKPEKAQKWTEAFERLFKAKVPSSQVRFTQRLPPIAFGAAAWTKYFGDVGVEPPLPPDIDRILESPCLFWEGKKVKDTHLLVLVPEDVKGRPLNLRTLGELIQNPRQGSKTKYDYFRLGQYRDVPPTRAHWVLMTRDVLPGSLSKSYADQQAFVAQRGQYEVPHLLDAVVCVLMEHIRTGTRLYRDKPSIWTSCQEQYNKDQQLGIGSLGPNGLRICFRDNCADETRGVRAVRKFFPPERLPDIAFGAVEWAKYFGDVGIEPLLPPDIDRILESPCPFFSHFWQGKTIRETHLLVLVPEMVDGYPLTLKTLGELIQKPKQGPKTKYEYFNLGCYQDVPPTRAHWVLMTRDVLPRSCSKSYADQQALVAHSGPYEVPHVLDAAVCVLMEQVRTGTRLYSKEPRTFTRCQENYDDRWQLVVGGFGPGGLNVYNYYCVHETLGVGAVRKFS